MKIETKFVVGQGVCYLGGTKLISGNIHSIGVDIAEKTKVRYYFKNNDSYTVVEECNVFENRETFLKQLYK